MATVPLLGWRAFMYAFSSDDRCSVLRTVRFPGRRLALVRRELCTLRYEQIYALRMGYIGRGGNVLT